MPSVDVTSLITGLNPIRQTSSYTMPVLSPRHGSSLTGAYRSTFSSSSIDRPYTNSYSSPRSYSYSERYTTRSYTSDDGKKTYSRHASITEDGVTTRFREEVLDSVADLRSRYSPANYVPAVLRKNDTYTRSKSITNDIGKPPIERTEVKSIKLKKDPDNATEHNTTANRDKTNCLLEHNPTTKNIENTTWNENASMEVADTNKVFNHTSNFPSFIPNKNQDAGNEAMNEGDDSEMENAVENNDIFYQNSNNDLSTSPRLTGLQNNHATSSNSSALNNIIPVSRSSPISDERHYDRASSNVKNQGLNGLKNIGNTCFMNSVIQCLSNTRYLLEYVRGDVFLDDINTTISGMKGSLIKAFSQVIQELWSDSSDRVVNTLALKSQIQRFAPRFMGYSQQDAQEFLRYLLEGLHEDVNRVTSKPTPIHTEIDEKLSDSQKSEEAWRRYLRMDNSRIVDVFVGQLKSTLRCTHCGHCSVTFDPFWDLSLPIPQRQCQLRLQQCLEHFTREETLDGDEKPTCSKCKERRKCTKSFTIQKFPKILVIHLKRFSPTERFRGKLSVIIDFPLNGLDLSQYAATTGHGDCIYNLYAISNHSGTTYSGHYTAYCKHPYSQQWHEYNDSRVSSITPKSVVSSEAYVLFYELTGQHSHL